MTTSTRAQNNRGTNTRAPGMGQTGQTGTGQQRAGQSGMGSMLARGGSILAASLLFLLGVYHFFSGIAGFAQDNFYNAAANYPYDLSSNGWGWLHVIGGVLLAITGLSLFSRNATWARPVAIVLLVASLIINFFFLAFFPLWALPMIALAIFAIWAIARDGSENRQRESQGTMMGQRGTSGSPQQGSQQQGSQQQGSQQQGGQSGLGQQQQAGTGSYVSSGTYGTGATYGASQSGQRWPENAGEQGRNWAPADAKDSGSRLGENAQEHAQSGARSAGQAGRSAAEDAANRAQQGRPNR